MAKSKVRTLYRTAVGVNYIIKNLKTNEEIVATTLNNRDKDRRPWRSPKGTPPGQEFFWMKLGNSKKGFIYIKFMNSSLNDRCLSDDGVWEFIGRRPNGQILPKLNEKSDNAKASKKTTKKKTTKRKKPVKSKSSRKKKSTNNDSKEYKTITKKDLKGDFYDEEAIDELLKTEKQNASRS